MHDIHTVLNLGVLGEITDGTIYCPAKPFSRQISLPLIVYFLMYAVLAEYSLEQNIPVSVGMFRTLSIINTQNSNSLVS